MGLREETADLAAATNVAFIAIRELVNNNQADLSLLDTEAKDSLVSAINEVHSELGTGSGPVYTIGNGDPTGGNDGDTYTDYATPQTWWQKESGTWVAKFTINNTVPANAVLDADGNPMLDANGEFILTP